MNSTQTVAPYPLLIDWVVDRSSLAVQTMLVLGGSLFLTASAKIAVPIGPVPVTFQTLAVLLLGVVLGKRLGTLAVLTYLTQGLCGLPVFFDMLAGPIKFLGPTGGYLIGMVPAAWIAGYAAERGKDRKFWTALPYLAVAHQVIFVFGVLWLSLLLGSFERGFTFGYLPFFGLDIAKFVLASAAVAGLWKTTSHV